MATIKPRQAQKANYPPLTAAPEPRTKATAAPKPPPAARGDLGKMTLDTFLALLTQEITQRRDVVA